MKHLMQRKRTKKKEKVPFPLHPYLLKRKKKQEKGRRKRRRKKDGSEAHHRRKSYVKKKGLTTGLTVFALGLKSKTLKATNQKP